MFDLFRRRDTFLRYVLMGLLGLVAISMVWYLIPGAMSGTSTGAESTLAEIGGDRLTVQEVTQRAELMLRQSGMQRQTAYPLVSNMVDQMIAGRAMEYQAAKMGFRVTDADVVEGIKQSVPQLFPGGQFVGKETYASFLRQNGISVPEFESQVRRQLLTTRVVGLVDEGVIVSPADVEAEYRRKNDQIRVEFIAIREADLKKQVTVSDAEIAADYEKKKANLTVPEKRFASVFWVDEALTAASVPVNEADLRRAYEEQRDRFRTPERLHVRHILLKTTGKSDAEVKTIQAKADSLLKQIKGGADFADLAKKNSEDPGSAVNGGDLGFVVKGQTVKNFEEAAFALKPKELSNVVKTEYGFHILQMMDREDARLKPFEEAKAELVAETQRQVVFDRMQRNIDNLRTFLSKNPTKGVEAAAQFGAQMTKTGLIGPGDATVQGFGPAPELIAQIFGAKSGEVTGVVQGQGNKLGVAVVDGVQPQRPAKLEEVSTQLRDQIVVMKAQALLKGRVDEIYARAKAPGADLKKIAADFKLDYKNPPAFSRVSAAEGLGGGVMLSESFGKPVGFVGQPVGVVDSRFVTRVTETIPADLTKLATERETIVGGLKQQRAQERNEIASQALVQKLTKEGKIKVNQDALKRLLAQFSATS